MPVRFVDLGSAKDVTVVSDVHMRHPDDERTKMFCWFLDQLVDSDILVLLGDIFDFINARQSFYYKMWLPVFSKLRALRNRGIKIVFIEGNHDYGFEHNPYSEISDCFDFCGDFIAQVQHEKIGNVLLLHSDDVVCPPAYRMFRGLVKSRIFQALMSPIPGAATSALFSRYASISRSKDEYRTLSGEFLTKCVDDFITKKAFNFSNTSVCIFGHIHVCLDDKRENIRFVSGPDWFSAPSSIRLTAEGQLERSWYCSEADIPKQFVFDAKSDSLVRAQ